MACGRAVTARLLRVSARVRDEDLDARPQLNLALRGGPQAGEDCALGVYRAGLRRDHLGAVPGGGKGPDDVKAHSAALPVWAGNAVSVASISWGDSSRQ